MIVVTGANGQLGRGVIAGLLARQPAEKIAAVARDPAKAADLAARGVVVRGGDFGDRAGITSAFAGASQVLVVSVNTLGGAARTMHRTAIEAARSVGAGRILYTSHMGTHANSPFDDHHAAEAILAETGRPFTALRHGFYAESAFHLVGGGFESGEIRVPEDGPISWTARDDLAEADAIVLADGRLDGVSSPLTAPEALTMADLAAIASDVTGRTIRRIVVPDATWREEKIAAGAPEPMVDRLLAVWRDAREGVFASSDRTLSELLGRSPRPMYDVIAERLGRQP